MYFSLEYWDPNKDESPKTENGQVLTYLNVGTGKEISLKNLAQESGQQVILQEKFLGTIQNQMGPQENF